ncbi:hypothetical protein AXX17_AT3G40980 [Arabidopsis thaliana]|uniref:Uncharacterized protein n=1 Tax=Arabidopsis thaliana TaxID=3702 RepID=A0A178VFX1_ARATH|nr:hypothetical protein AXX17_AT3G40980 [Arabidopsis thaliana]
MSSSNFSIFCIVLIFLASLHECDSLRNPFKDDPLRNPITNEKVKEPPCYPYGKQFKCTGFAGTVVVDTADRCWSFCAAANKRP